MRTGVNASIRKCSASCTADDSLIGAGVAIRDHRPYPPVMETTTESVDRNHRAAAAPVYNVGEWHAVAHHPAVAAATRATRMTARGLVFFAFSFIEVLAELLAPIVLVFGIGWSALPGILSMAGPEGQAREFVATVVQAIPKEIHLGHTVITPTSLIVDGVLLVAVVALCRTVQALVTTTD